jgi:hypothetical protein
MASMVCPQCKGLFDQRLQCPKCGTRLFHQAVGRAAAPAPLPAAASEPWQHTALGRLLVGVVLAQGLAYVLRLLYQAALLVDGQQDTPALGATLTGLVLLQSMQAVGLLAGGALAGAGQPRGALLGAAVGLVNGFVSVVILYLGGQPVTEMLLYGQPALHLVFGALGGLVGVLVWRPLPALALASPPGEGRKGPRPALANAALSAPVNWVRVLLGTTVILAGVSWPNVILKLVIEASQGRMNLTSHLQAELVTWEISALVVLLGAGLAGTCSVSGLKQGLCAGVLSDLLFLAIRTGTGQPLTLHQLVFTLLGVVVLSALGGWFGGQLFPPLAAGGRKGLGRVLLSRADA